VQKSRASLLATVARAFLTAALLCATAIPAFAASAVPSGKPSIVSTLSERVAAITELGTRAEGSAGEAAAFDYIERSLSSAGMEPGISGFSDASDGFSTSRIVEARIRGSREDELSVIVPVSSWVDSPDPSEGAYGIAVALGEAARLSAEARSGSEYPISLRFVFLGAEKRGKMAEDRVSSLGTETWLSRRAGEDKLAVLYLNIAAAPSRIALRSAGKGVLSPYWYFESARRALEDSGIRYALEVNRLQAYRLGLVGDYGPSAPYLEAGIPAIELRGENGDFPPETAAANDAGETWLGSFIESFAKAESGGFTDTWDRHYFIFQIGKLNVVLREKIYVALLVALLALVAFSFLIITVARRPAVKRLLKRTPALGAEVLALFVALAFVFLVGKGIARIDAAVLGSSDAWRVAPRIFAAARILSSFLLFLSLLSFLVEKRALTPNPYFYEFAAMACLAVDVLVFSAVDLSASFYFVWALILVEISLSARSRWVTLVAYAFMYVPLLVIAGELAAKPDLPTYEKLIAPGYLGVLILSALTLPFFVFTASPLLFFARPGAAARKKAVAFFAVCAIAVESLSLVYAIVEAPRSGPRRKDLRVSETIDQDTGEFSVELAGNRRLGKGSIDRGGVMLEYDSMGDRAYLRGRDTEKRISLSEKESPFLDRVDEGIVITFANPPYQVDIALESASEILMYDCSLPYKVAVDGRKATIYSGVNPGQELSLSLTVPSSFKSRLVVTARYLGHLVPYAQSSGSLLDDEGLAVKGSFDIGSGRR
jgi:hypothetical protein